MVLSTVLASSLCASASSSTTYVLWWLGSCNQQQQQQVSTTNTEAGAGRGFKIELCGAGTDQQPRPVLIQLCSCYFQTGALMLKAMLLWPNARATPVPRA